METNFGRLNSNEDKYPSYFKLKTVIELLKEETNIDELLLHHNLRLEEVESWKAEYLAKASIIIQLAQVHSPKDLTRLAGKGSETNDILKLVLKNLEKILREDEDAPISYSSGSDVNDTIISNENENILMDYEGLNYVRYMKRFNPSVIRNFNIPTDLSLFANLEGTDKPDLNKVINSPFHLRFYLPKNLITRTQDDQNPVRQKIVIMINGMNEVHSFSFYDILGEYFAENDIAAVLLPTPLHLNRRLSKKYNISTTSKESYLPTDLAKIHPSLFYSNFLKTYDELTEIVNKINPPKTPSNDKIIDNEFMESWWKNDKVDCAFYKKHFWTNEEKARTTDVVLLGYSLGGLKALSYFLKANERFRCCISFNSSPNLKVVVPDALKIDDKIWMKMTEDAQNYLSHQVEMLPWEIEIFNKQTKRTEAIQPQDAMELRRIFGDLYFGENTSVVKNKFRFGEIIKRYLAITSGSDRIVTKNEFKNLLGNDVQINHLVVAGVDHNPTIDQNWHDVLPRVENNILSFIDTCKEQHYKRNDIAKQMGVIVSKLPYFENPINNFNKHNVKFKSSIRNEEFERILSEIEIHLGISEVKIFLDLYYSSKGYFFNLTDLFNKVLRDLKNKASIH